MSAQSAQRGLVRMQPIALNWPVARYRFDLEVMRPMLLPDYAGSAFRGAFGRALRKTACMTRQSECTACPRFRSCAYTSIFESPAPIEHALQSFSKIPNPYVIEAPREGARELVPGGELQFSMVLFGRACRQLALIIHAVKRAFEHDVCRGSAVLKRVVHLGDKEQRLVCTDEDPIIKPHEQTVTLRPPEAPADVTICFDTQLRLQKNGKAYGPKDITPAPFFNALIRRAGLLSEFHAQKAELDFHALSALAHAVEARSLLQWQNWRRYSSRQQHGMFMGGVLGSWTFLNLPPALQLFLQLGTWIHVGENATFGLGRFHLAE